MKEKILVVGASGQLGTEMVPYLENRYGVDNVVCADLRIPENNQKKAYYTLDATNEADFRALVEKESITQVYQLVAMLSATAEQHPMAGWNLNMACLFNTLNMAKDGLINRVFWPSSIAVFGEKTPKDQTPQYTTMETNTVYGISKIAGEQWGAYYHDKYGVDFRSVRYPGLIGYKGLPGGGTTDYAIDIFHHAAKDKTYDCFLAEQTTLPMMFMDDAIKATVELMEADRDRLTVNTSYNISGLSFSPVEIHQEILKYKPDFEVVYKPDFRQEIAKTWPKSIDDTIAQKDWDWKPDYDLEKMAKVMLDNLA